MAALSAEQYIDAVRELPCCVCKSTPAAAHHVVGGSVVARLGSRGQRKHSDWLAIPLCHNHHQGEEGLHAVGVLTWEALHGTQEAFVEATGKKLGMDPWQEAEAEAARLRSRRRYQRPDKVMARRV